MIKVKTIRCERCGKDMVIQDNGKYYTPICGNCCVKEGLSKMSEEEKDIMRDMFYNLLEKIKFNWED